MYELKKVIKTVKAQHSMLSVRGYSYG